MDLESQFQKDCEYMTMLTHSEPQANLFPSSVKLLPPDIVKQIEITRRDQGLDKDK